MGLDEKNPKKIRGYPVAKKIWEIRGWGVCSWGWLPKPGPAFRQRKIPPGRPFARFPWARPARQKFSRCVPEKPKTTTFPHSLIAPRVVRDGTDRNRRRRRSASSWPRSGPSLETRRTAWQSPRCRACRAQPWPDGCAPLAQAPAAADHSACQQPARAMPAFTHARIMSRSYSANEPSTWNIILPAGVVVSRPC